MTAGPQVRWYFHLQGLLLTLLIDDDWNLVECLVDFHHVGDKGHAGAYAVKAFVKSAAGRGRLKKISRIHLKLII
jgi:hypothetical protein